MIPRTVAIVGVTAVIALGVGGASAASGSAPDSAKVRVMRVLDLTQHVKLVDADDSGGFSTGDTTIIRTQLRSLDGKQRLGNAFIACIQITIPQGQCTGTYRLRRGDITFSGLAPSSGVFRVAVTGGTGAFDRFGSGNIRIRNTDPSGARSIDTITLKR
jgi:hypothetical protein